MFEYCNLLPLVFDNMSNSDNHMIITLGMLQIWNSIPNHIKNTGTYTLLKVLIKIPLFHPHTTLILNTVTTLIFCLLKLFCNNMFHCF